MSGTYQLVFDTTSVTTSSLRGPSTSAAIDALATASDLETILENMPNVGDVTVTIPYTLTAARSVYDITFNSEVGDMPAFTVLNNLVVDSESLAGTVTFGTVGAGAIPANSFYSSYSVDMSQHTGPLAYVITDLVPGQVYFTRISASNQMGFGARRLTEPASLHVPIQNPGQPTSYYGAFSSPSLHIVSDSSLAVRIGSPVFDGGNPLTTLFVEWDTSSSFNSAADGSALGSDFNVPAFRHLCESTCISSFNVATNTFIYSPTSTQIRDDIQKELMAQQRIKVNFNDDNNDYTFSVISAQWDSNSATATVTVASGHLRTNSLGLTGSPMSSDMDLLSNEYTIKNLVPGNRYFVRVSATNDHGSGAPISTLPASEVPRSAPTLLVQSLLRSSA